MAIQTQPSRISEPFAGSGTKNVIPATNATPSASQAASWASGFPPECSQPISAGGCPVPRNDMNGVLNWLSQGFAYNQDGGVWAWSALADYDIGRIVRGSDGLLYQSKAQSGPGVAAGAQDPVSDTGFVYWQAPNVPTMPEGDLSDAVASTRWVRAFTAYAVVYVDGANGSDSNDGLTQATALQTIAAALAMAAQHNGRLKIYIAAGSYSESIVLPLSSTIEIELQGNISISGNITVESSYLAVYGSYTLTTGDYVLLISNAYAVFYCNLVVSALTRSAVGVEDSSYIDCRGTLNITSSSTTNISSLLFVNKSGGYFYENVSATQNTSGGTGLNCARGCAVRFAKNLSLSGSGVETGIYITSCSSFHCSGDVTVAEGMVSGHAILVSVSSSFVLAAGTSVIHGSSIAANATIQISRGSSFDMGGSASLTLWSHYSGSRVLYLWNNSNFAMNTGETLAFRYGSGVTPLYILNVYTSSFDVSGSPTIDFGTTTVTSGVLECTLNGACNISKTTNIIGTITGRRFLVDYGGQVFVHGAGDAFLPGTVAGQANAASYGYYH